MPHRHGALADLPRTRSHRRETGPAAGRHPMTRHEQDHRIESDERLALRQREQLSAFADGGLPAEQARFLLRRLAHDDALAGCLERWQLAGDAMRGNAVHAVRGDALRARVAAAVAEVPVAPRARAGWGWPRVAGLAAAASVAAIALVLVRPSLEPAASGEAPAIAASIAAPGLPD